jgi:hypothetical protein
MAYFDTRKTTDIGTAPDARTIFDRLVGFIAARVTATVNRPGKAPQEHLAAQHRTEAARRAVDDLMR